MKVQENVITTRGNGAETIGKWRRRVKLLETYIENAWKCREPEETLCSKKMLDKDTLKTHEEDV